MAVYVDDMKAAYRRMVMCHMLADTEKELHAMAREIGISRRWYQENSRFPHYDICLSKRKLAVWNGAIEVTQRQLGCMALRAEAEGIFGPPDEAIAWVRSRSLR